MDTKKLLIWLVIAAAVVPLIKTLWMLSQSSMSAPKIDRSQVVCLVEETLEERQGEAGLVMQAFEAALAQEARLMGHH